MVVHVHKSRFLAGFFYACSRNSSNKKTEDLIKHDLSKLGDEFSFKNSPNLGHFRHFPTFPASQQPIQRPSQPGWQSTQKELVWRVLATRGRLQRPAPEEKRQRSKIKDGDTKISWCVCVYMHMVSHELFGWLH